MRIEVTAHPDREPVTMQDVYDWLRLDVSGSPSSHPHDAMLRILIQAAREAVENDTRRSLVEQSLLVSCGRWRDAVMWRPPLISVNTVKYYDESNRLQTLDPASYYVKMDVVPSIAINDGYSWPSVYARDDAVNVYYTSGYVGISSPDIYVDGIPAALKQAILLHVQMHYDNLKPSEAQEAAVTYERLVARFRVPKV